MLKIPLLPRRVAVHREIPRPAVVRRVYEHLARAIPAFLAERRLKASEATPEHLTPPWCRWALIPTPLKLPRVIGSEAASPPGLVSVG